MYKEAFLGGFYAQLVNLVESVFGKMPVDKNTPITLTPVKSSNIAAIGYAPDKRTLEIKFNPNAKTGKSSQYRYPRIPAALYKEFQDAESKGKYFHNNIRPFKNYEKVAGLFPFRDQLDKEEKARRLKVLKGMKIPKDIMLSLDAKDAEKVYKKYENPDPWKITKATGLYNLKSKLFAQILSREFSPALLTYIKEHKGELTGKDLAHVLNYPKKTPLNEKVVKHEIGHYKDWSKMKNLDEINAYLHPDNDYKAEVSAWDHAKIKRHDKLRRLALESYR